MFVRTFLNMRLIVYDCVIHTKLYKDDAFHQSIISVMVNGRVLLLILFMVIINLITCKKKVMPVRKIKTINSNFDWEDWGDEHLFKIQS